MSSGLQRAGASCRPSSWTSRATATTSWRPTSASSCARSGAGSVSGALADCIAAGLPTVASATLAAALDAPDFVRRGAGQPEPGAGRRGGGGLAGPAGTTGGAAGLCGGRVASTATRRRCAEALGPGVTVHLDISQLLLDPRRSGIQRAERELIRHWPGPAPLVPAGSTPRSGEMRGIAGRGAGASCATMRRRAARPPSWRGLQPLLGSARRRCGRGAC